MIYTRKFLSVFVLAALLALIFITPAHAFDGRGGDRVVVTSDEIVNDDLYVGAQEFVLDGTVNGDLIAFAQTVTINGTVNGDLMAAAQTVVVNGEVTGGIRMAGSVLFVGENASIGGDIVSAGYSLEVRPGSTIGQDLVFAGGQTLLAGDVARNVHVAGGSFELRGDVGGDVMADVGGATQTQGPPQTLFMPQSSVPAPNVKPGFTIDPSAKITGDLKYTYPRELTFPAGIVGGKVTYTVASSESGTISTPQQTSGQLVAKWALDLVRDSVTLLLIGLFLLWLFPFFVKGLSDQLQSKPLPSLGWGVVAWAAFFFVLLVVLFFMIAGGIVFGLLTLAKLTGTLISVGILTLLGLVIGFVLVTAFVAKVIFGAALGRWIFQQANSPLAEHRYWPMVVGVLITVALIALLSFPLIPGFLGGLLNFAVVLLGLGALWLWGRERMTKQAVTS